MNPSVLGWIGLFGIAYAWFLESYHVVKTKHTNIPLFFTIIYIISSGLLVAYSFLIGDIIFILLNALATLSAVVHLVVRILYVKN